MSGSPYAGLIGSAAGAYGVPPSVLNWQIGQESSFDPYAVNPSGTAFGLAQITANAPSYMTSINPFDPAASINAAARYDAQLYGQTGSWAGALTGYGTVGPSSPASVQAGAYSVLAAVPNGLAQPGAAGSYLGTSASGSSLGNAWNFLKNFTIQKWFNPFSTGAGSNPANGPAMGIAPSIANMTGTKGTATWATEIALRGALILLGALLIITGFYIAGKRRAPPIKVNVDELARIGADKIVRDRQAAAAA